MDKVKLLSNAIAQANEKVSKNYVVNNAVSLDNLWKYNRTVTAIDIIEDILELAEDDELNTLSAIVVSKGTLDILIDNIIEDDYIIPDWNSYTDDHEYFGLVMDIAERLLK